MNSEKSFRAKQEHDLHANTCNAKFSHAWERFIPHTLIVQAL